MKRAHTVSLLAALYLVSAVPAQSQDVFSFIQNMSGKYAMTWSDLESRRSQLEVEINSAASTSKINAAQATDFRTELATITQQINAAKVDGRRLGISQSISLSNKINVLAGALGGAIEHKVASLPDINALQLQLNTQIDTAVAAGQISAATATTLKAEMQQIAVIEAAYRADTGSNLTPRQIELLSGKLATAKANIDQQVRIGQSAIPALNDRRTAIETKIQSAFTTGRISAGEAENLKSDLARIAAQQATFQSGSGVLTGTQVYQLAQSLDQVDDRITARMSSTPNPSPTVSTVEVDRLREQIANRINQLVASGRITNAEASVADHDLDQIASLSTAYKTSAGGIRPHQVDRLLSDLSGINTRLDTQLATSGNFGGNRGGGYRDGGNRGGGNRGGGYRDGGNRGGDNRGGDSRGGDNRGGDNRGGDNRDDNNDDNLVTNNSGATVTTGGGFNVSNLPVINAKNFADVRGYWGEPYVNELASRNVIGGFPNGSFAPNDEITRAQFAAIVIKALNLQPSSGGRVFTDVPSSHWAAGAIAAASNAGLIGGFPDGTFKPADNITRAQALVILSKTLRNPDSSTRGLQAYTDRSAVPTWAEANVAQAANAKIIVNFPDASQIRPNALATRGEVAGLMYQTLNSIGANLPQMRIGVNASGM